MRATPIVMACAALALSACASGPTPDAPKSNMFARANILSANPLSISISHSDWGKRIAFQWADEHCAKYGKSAVYVGAAPDLGANTTSTWRCE